MVLVGHSEVVAVLWVVLQGSLCLQEWGDVPYGIRESMGLDFRMALLVVLRLVVLHLVVHNLKTRHHWGCWGPLQGLRGVRLGPHHSPVVHLVNQVICQPILRRHWA